MPSAPPPPVYPPPPVPSASTLQRRDQKAPKHHAGQCMSCYKEAELVDGLCADCKWKIENGILPPVKIEKKHHFWNRKS